MKKSEFRKLIREEVVKIFNEELATSSDSSGEFFLKMLAVRDQAHIFHWQTKSNSHHTILGEFYESYLDELDEFVENIFGVTGKTFTVGNGEIKLVDYNDSNLKSYLIEAENLFTVEFQKLYPESDKKNLGLHHIVGDLIEEIGKLKYLLSQK